MAPSTKKKRRRSSSKRDGFSLRSVESLFSRQLLKIIGVIFLGASLWFAANSSDTLFKVAKNLISPKEMISSHNMTQPLDDQQSIAEPISTPTPPVSGMMILWLVVTTVGWIVLQVLTRWRRRVEFQAISVFLVFMVLLILIRNYGWQIPFYFSFLILISAGLYFFGRHLSHLGTRINFLFTWGLFTFWWLLKIMINGEYDQLTSFFLFASLLFLTFHLILLFKGFAGHKTLSSYVEVGAIALNLFLYFAMMAATLLKFYSYTHLFFFTLGLSILYLLSLLAMAQLQRPFRRVPFLICTLILMSLLLPLLFGNNKIILLTGSLSILLMIYSKITKDQPSIIMALIIMALMVLMLMKDLLLSYLPAAFIGGLMDNSSLFYKGLIATLFVALVAFSNRKLLKGLEIQYSRKWFSRRRYMKLLKGVFLAGLYICLFWIWQYIWFAVFQSEGIQFLSWFTFHCLFFIIAIPWLAAQGSTFLHIAVLVSVIMTLIYPSLLSLQNLTFLDLYVRGIPSGLLIFPLHYISAGFFLVFIAVVLRYVGKAFKENTLAKRIFLVYAVFMVLFVLISEMILTGVALTAKSSLDIAEREAILYRFPATAIIVVAGWILLGWGFIRQKRFVRTLALILLVISAIKFIYFDPKTLSLMLRVVLLFITGAVFITLSLAYNRARKSFRKKRPQKSYSPKPEFPKVKVPKEKPQNI